MGTIAGGAGGRRASLGLDAQRFGRRQRGVKRRRKIFFLSRISRTTRNRASWVDREAGPRDVTKLPVHWGQFPKRTRFAAAGMLFSRMKLATGKEPGGELHRLGRAAAR